MLVYAVEKLIDAKAEIEALVPAQWSEMAQGFESFMPGPDWNTYARAEQMDRGILITARDPLRGLVGYFGLLLVPNSSMGGALTALSTPYYVVASPWRGFILRRLIAKAVAIVKERGVDMIAIKTHPWASAGPILTKMQFREAEVWYMLDCKGASHA